MVKVKSKSLRVLTLGKVDQKNIYLKPEETKDLPDTPEFSEIVAKAEEDGFIEILSKESLLDKVLPKKTEKATPEKETKDSEKSDKE